MYETTSSTALPAPFYCYTHFCLSNVASFWYVFILWKLETDDWKVASPERKQEAFYLKSNKYSEVLPWPWLITVTAWSQRASAISVPLVSLYSFMKISIIRQRLRRHSAAIELFFTFTHRIGPLFIPYSVTSIVSTSLNIWSWHKNIFWCAVICLWMIFFFSLTSILNKWIQIRVTHAF